MLQNSHTNKLVIFGCAGIALCMALLLGSLRAWMDHKRHPYNDRPFNAKQWKAAQTFEGRKLRAQMAGDILKHSIKPGMTETQVISLLGPYDKELGLGGFAPSNRSDVQKIDQYDMGPAWGSMAGEHEILRVYFDAKDRCLWAQTEVD